MSASDKVFSGAVTMSAVAWTTFVLDTPFEYDGTSNLVLVVDDNTNGYDHAPYMSCSVYSTEENQALYAYSAATNYNPLAPPTTSEYNSNVLSVKNHILLGIESGEEEQTLNLSEGWNWFSTNVEITLGDLQNALETALPGATITIKSKTAYTTYNGSTWRGVLKTLDVSQMYKIYVGAGCEITLTGGRVNVAEHPVVIHNGANWIGFPLSETMSLSNAFAGFAVSGDMVRCKTTSSTYNGSVWRGTLNTLVPGQGYIYKSNVQDDRTFTFPSQRIHTGD